MDHAGVSAPIPQLWDLWLDDTDKNVGSNLPLLFKLQKNGQLILRKIIKIVATRCQILRLKCTKFHLLLSRRIQLPSELRYA